MFKPEAYFTFLDLCVSVCVSACVCVSVCVCVICVTVLCLSTPVLLAAGQKNGLACIFNRAISFLCPFIAC